MLQKYGILMYVKVIEEEKIQIYLTQAEFSGALIITAWTNKAALDKAR